MGGGTILQGVERRLPKLAQFRQELVGAERLLKGLRSITFVPCPEPRHLFSQFGSAQQLYYLLFRKQFLERKALRADLGYVTLLAQEIIHGTVGLPDPVMGLFLLVCQYAHRFPLLQQHGADWVLALNALRGARHAPGRLAATLTGQTKHVTHSDLILDGVMSLVLADHNLGEVDLDLLLGLTPENRPLEGLTKDKEFIANVTRLAVAAFVNAHVQPGLLLRRRTFTYWEDQRQRPVLVPPFAGLLHDLPPRSLQVGTSHTYSEATIPALREAVRDVQRYALYLARAIDEEPQAADASATRVRADAHRSLRALIDEQLPDDLRRRGVIIERTRGGLAYGISIEEFGGFTRSRYDVPTGSKERYELARALHLKRLNDRSDEPVSAPSQRHYYYSHVQDLVDLTDQEAREFTGWRTRWRTGRTTTTTPAILNAYAAEVVNLWGFDSPQEAYDELWRLALAYPQALASNANSWLVDFARVYEVSDTPNEVQLRLLRTPDLYGHTSAAVTAWLASKDYSQLDLKLIATLTRFSPESGVFYERTERRELYEEALPQVIELVAEQYRARHGVDVFEHLAPQEKWYDYHQRYRSWNRLFGGLTHDPSLQPQRALYVADDKGLQKLARLLGNALKYTENIFRRSEKIGGQRKIENMHGWTKELREGLDTLLAKLLAPPKPKPQVRIDPERLAQLERDSAGIRERLIDPALLEEAEREAQQRQAPPPASDTPAVGTIAAIGASDEYSELVAVLEAGEMRLLTLIAAGATPTVLEGVARELRTPLTLIIDRVNERALDVIGDNLIDTYEDPPVIIDEHHDEVRRALEEGTA